MLTKPIRDKEIAAKLRVVMSRLIKILRTEMKSDDLLSLTERSTLALVYQYTAILPSELSAMEKVTGQSMSQIINKLLSRGYVKKTPSRTDKRKVIITITAAGKKTIDLKRHEKEEWLAKSIFEKTSQKEKNVLVSAIKVLTKLVDLK
jgi:DNA-binding MarR family transcriptional regulator